MPGSNFGAKVSQTGFDVNTAADKDLLFSSSWPSLKIEKTGTAFISDTTVDVDIYTHNLGYPPLFIIFNYTSDKTFMIGPRQRQTEPRWYVTKNKLGMVGQGSLSLDPFNIRWYICRLPLDQPFQAPNIKLSSTASGQSSKDLGIKISKEGKDISSTDLRDFTLHSGTRSPMIHNVTTGLLALGSDGFYHLTWTNDLGYNPLYFSFTRVEGVLPAWDDHWFGPINLAALTIGTAPYDLSAFDTTATSHASIVIFKDPFIAPQIQTLAF